VDPQLLALLVGALAPQTKSGSNITQSDIDPFQQLILSQLMGTPSQKPVDEDMIRRMEAPQWTAISNYGEYTEEDLEPKIQQFIMAGLPLSQVEKSIKEELKKTGKASKDNLKSANALAKELYSEFVNANNKIQQAKTKSFESSPYTKMGISDPSDYPTASVEDTVGLYPEMFAKLASQDRYRAFAKPVDPETSKEIKGAKYEPRTQGDEQFLALQRSVQKTKPGSSIKLDTEGVKAMNKFREAQKASDLASLARTQQRNTNTQLRQSAEQKSSNDLLKRIVLTKVLDNPKLFANPEVQKILGT
jgi:hypothetical protein